MTVRDNMITDKNIIMATNSGKSSKVLLFNSHHPKLKTKFLEAQEKLFKSKKFEKSTLAEKPKSAIKLEMVHGARR